MSVVAASISMDARHFAAVRCRLLTQVGCTAGETANADIDFADGGLVVSIRGSAITIIPHATTDLAARACALAGRELMNYDWPQFVGNRPQITCTCT